MALEPVRTANALGSAVAVLSPGLDDLVWTNSAGAALLSLPFGDPIGLGREPAGAGPSLPVLKQIQSASDALRAKGRTQLLLRPASADIGRAVLARLERLAGPDGDLALLTVRLDIGAGESRTQLSQRLLRESGLAGAMACIVSDEGFVVGTDSLPAEEHSLLGAQGREFLMADEDRLTVEDDFGALSFAKVSEDLVLIHLGTADTQVAVTDSSGVEPRPVALVEIADAAPDPSIEREPEPGGIGRLVERWHSRGPVDEMGDAANDEELDEEEFEHDTRSQTEDAVPTLTTGEAEIPAPYAASVGDADIAVSSSPEPDNDTGDEQTSSVAAVVESAAFIASLDAEPVRFVWQIDADGCFSSFSPEFAATVGPRAADVIGRSFSSVATVYGFDEKGEIGRLLARRDTWSGRSVLWPLEGTDRRAPVDLAALPIYGRDRAFEGFRGFGVVRPAESVVDPDSIGRILSATAIAPLSDAEDISKDEAPPAVLTPASVPPASAAKLRTISAAEPLSDAPSAFGRRAEPPAAQRADLPADERRRPNEAVLSTAEEAAFLAIGAELGIKPRAAAAPPAKRDEAKATTDVADLGKAPTAQSVPATEDAAGDAVLPAHELEAMLDALPLAVLVQMQERLVFANRRFFALTGYPDLDALEDAGGLDHLVASCGVDETDSEASLVRADGTTERTRLHLQRVSVAGRSCLMMSFPQAEPVIDRQATAIVDLQGEVQELQAVLDTATDGIVLLDGTERVRKMNGSAEALFGLRPEQYQGLPFTDLLAAESRQVALDYIEMLRDDGLAAILNDGREVTAKVAEGGATIPLFVTLGRLSDGRGWCVVIRDIAQWKHAESDLVTARRQAEDASLHKSRFLANISHELRTPLNAIIGFADVMASECFGPIGHDRYLEYLGDIKRSGHHLLDLVNDLLDISKIEAGKVELAFESVLLNEVVAEVVSLMQPQANRERVIVRSVLPTSVPPVVADRRSVRQIALNLIANAVRFTPAGGQIIASTHYGGEGEVTLRFRDSGIGMTEREIEMALTPFQQVNAGNRGRGEGTGLGLPLTKAMVEANRALFSIVSAPGEGTLVEITFPAQRVLAD